MWLGRGSTAMIGLVLILGGVVAMALIVWGLEPHGAAKRARDRRRPRGRGHLAPVFSEAEFEAIEDALEPARKPGDGIIS